MKLNSVIILFVAIFLVSCAEPEMEVNDYLKNNSKLFVAEIDRESSDNLVTIGHFSTFDREFGLAWLDNAGLSEFLDNKQLESFSSTNNDNYTYDNIISESSDQAQINSFVEKFSIPLDNNSVINKAYLGYFYAPHDEYAMIFYPDAKEEVNGYLTNGFDLYEIIAVSAAETAEILGYQIVLNKEYVGSIQLKDKHYFRMSTEFCDATEIVLGSIASMILKTQIL